MKDFVNKNEQKKVGDTGILVSAVGLIQKKELENALALGAKAVTTSEEELWI